MSIVSLTNDGLIPMEAVTTMGISAKEGENPIGFFGTGLKYAIAALLRLSHKVTIHRGLERYDFTVCPGEVRGKEFGFIIMKGPDGEQRLGFTTHLGARWEIWQVFRELYSNCLDEAGEISFSAVAPAEGKTTIHVRGEDFASAARQRDRYFLSSAASHSGVLVDIHPGASSGIYYRGVLVSPLERPSAFTYNITTTMDLTEDRTLKHRYSADAYVSHALANCTDREIVRKAVLSDACYEGTLAFSDPCADFVETVMALCEEQGVAAVTPNAVRSSEVWAKEKAKFREAILSSREAHDIERAKSFLAQIGYPITAPVLLVETLGPDVFGMAKDGHIYIAKIAITRGGNFLIGTLLEEQLHLSHGFRDESRRFQDFLIDLVVKFAKDAAFERAAA